MLMSLDTYKKGVFFLRIYTYCGHDLMCQYHYIYGSMLCDKGHIFIYEQAQCNSLSATIMSYDSGHLALLVCC
jgi:hypothetical protein